MTTANLPKLPEQPKHGRDWTRDKPTVGAVILFLLIGIGLGVQTLISGFSNANVNAKIRTDEQCQAAIQNENLNRNKILTDLAGQERAAVNRWIARVTEDVIRNHIADIPRAYEAYRQEVESIGAARAEQGAVISATVLPSNCRLRLGGVAPTALPSLTAMPRSTLPTSLPRLTETATFTAQATVTRTVSGGVVTFTAEVPGPTHIKHVTVTMSKTVPAPRITRTVTVAPRATRTVRVTITRTVTVTVTRTVPPIPTKTR